MQHGVGLQPQPQTVLCLRCMKAIPDSKKDPNPEPNFIQS